MTNEISQHNLAKPSLIPGLIYMPDYISQVKHDELLNYLNPRPWSLEIGRPVQHYGYKYHYLSQKIDASMMVEPLPPLLKELAFDIVKCVAFQAMPDQAIVNKYYPGQGIGAHIDCEPCFGEVVASISLGSQCVMNFTHAKGIFQPERLVLEPRSLLVLTGEARHEWKHGIAKQDYDYINDVKTPRVTRVSITFRTVKLS